MKKASAGAFEPPDEILTIATKRHVTQIRRITSLKQRLRHERELTENSPKFKGLLDEWCCILRAPVLAKHFAFWIAQQPELGNPPWPLPTCQWLEDLLSLTQHHLRIAVAHDRKVFNSMAKVAQQTDNKYLKGRNVPSLAFVVLPKHLSTSLLTFTSAKLMQFGILELAECTARELSLTSFKLRHQLNSKTFLVS